MARWKFSTPRPGDPYGSAVRGPRSRSRDRGKSLDLYVDLYVATALIVAASSMAALMPSDNPLRTITVLGFLLLVPGYLFLQALIVQERSRAFQPAHAIVAVGISPVVVGFLALSTTFAPVAFRLSTAFAVVVVACFMLAMIAFARRRARLLAVHPAPVGPPR